MDLNLNLDLDLDASASAGQVQVQVRVRVQCDDGLAVPASLKRLAMMANAVKVDWQSDP